MDVYLIHHKTQHNLFSIVVGVTRDIEDTLKIKRVLLYPFGKRVNTENSILHLKNNNLEIHLRIHFKCTRCFISELSTSYLSKISLEMQLRIHSEIFSD